MKNKSVFSQIILLIVIALVCAVVTICIAFLAGSYDTIIFNLENLNIANMIPVFIAGGFISCVIIGIVVLCISKTIFLKVKNYLSENNKTNLGE